MTANVPAPPGGGSGFPAGGDRLVRGTLARWTETTGWVDRDGLPLPETMLVVSYNTVLQKWKDQRAEVISKHPLPDPKVLNDAIPVSEWEPDFTGKPTPPWKLTYVVYMVNLQTGAIYTYVNNTYGAMVAYNNLEEQIGVMQMLRGEQVFPIVRLEKRPMKTQFGMKSRPHLQPIDWRAPGGGGGGRVLSPPEPPAPQISEATTTSTPTTPTTPSTPTTPTTRTPTQTTPTPAASATTTASPILDNTKPVKPVTVAELVADEIPWK